MYLEGPYMKLMTGDFVLIKWNGKEWVSVPSKEAYNYIELLESGDNTLKLITSYEWNTINKKNFNLHINTDRDQL